MPNNPTPEEATYPEFGSDGDDMPDLPDGEVEGAIDIEDPDLNDYIPDENDLEDTAQWSNDGIT
jgi:hypothetical protein